MIPAVGWMLAPVNDVELLIFALPPFGRLQLYVVKPLELAPVNDTGENIAVVAQEARLGPASMLALLTVKVIWPVAIFDPQALEASKR